MIDLDERFDHAWTGEPDHPPVTHRLAAGRSHLRRRRLTVAGGVLVLGVALGGGMAAVVAADPAGTQVASDTPAPVDPDEPSGAQGVEVAQTAGDLNRIDPAHNAAYTEDGRVVVRPGWVVTQKVDEVYVGPGMRDAVGLEVTSSSSLEREWYFLSWGNRGHGAVNRSWPQANLGMTLRDWLPRPDGTRARP